MNCKESSPLLLGTLLGNHSLLLYQWLCKKLAHVTSFYAGWHNAQIKASRPGCYYSCGAVWVSLATLQIGCWGGGDESWLGVFGNPVSSTRQIESTVKVCIHVCGCWLSFGVEQYFWWCSEPTTIHEISCDDALWSETILTCSYRKKLCWSYNLLAFPTKARVLCLDSL